jgi:prolyl oligopeptidase
MKIRSRPPTGTATAVSAARLERHGVEPTALFLVALSLLMSTTGSLAAEETTRSALHDLFEAEWQWALAEDPRAASLLGDLRYNDRWPEVSLAAIERRHAHRREVLRKLEAFAVGSLSPADLLNYKVFRRDFEEAIEAHQYRWYLIALDQREGIQDESSLADALPFRKVKDFEDWIARLDGFPAYMDGTIGLLREGIRARMVQPKVCMSRVPAQIRRQIVEDPGKSLFYKPFLSFPDEVAAADRERLAAEARRAIAGKVVPAYARFLSFFEEEYYPACLDGPGAWRLPRGDELYAFRVRLFTTTRLTPDQVHEVGLREVARIRAEMEEVKRRAGFEGSFQQFLEHLRTDRRFYFEKPEDLLQAYRALSKRIDPELTKLFRTLPRIPYGVEPIPDNMAPDTTAAYYRPPAADGSRAGTYFVNLYRPEMRPKYEMEALSLHEAVPGHHLQIALATELENVPTFRRFASFTAYVEGWALYAESLGEELGLYRDPYSKFGQLTYEMWRAARLVVDTGIHAKRWTREQAIEYFKENTAKTELDITNEIDRYIAWPGQALAYKIGELEVKELRALAERELGQSFDVRDFHDVLLLNGALPLDILGEVVRGWIAARKTGAAAGK